VDTLVNPLADVEPGARDVHGLTDEELSAAPPFAEVREKLGAALAGRRVVVWNAEFDAAVIRRELARLQLPVPSLGWECAMRRYSDWQAGYRDARFLRLNGGHRAREDCAAVLVRLREMA
jgi:DNA polymerase-3 subunit epsilon